MPQGCIPFLFFQFENEYGGMRYEEESNVRAGGSGSSGSSIDRLRLSG